MDTMHMAQRLAKRMRHECIMISICTPRNFNQSLAIGVLLCSANFGISKIFDIKKQPLTIKRRWWVHKLNKGTSQVPSKMYFVYTCSPIISLVLRHMVNNVEFANSSPIGWCTIPMLVQVVHVIKMCTRNNQLDFWTLIMGYCGDC